MNSLIPLLAWRYVRGSYFAPTLSTMVLVCFLGIFVGSCALTLVVFVMDGFEQATSQKLQGIHPQVTLQAAHQQRLDDGKITAVLDAEFPAVLGSSPTMQQYVLTGAITDENFSLIMMRGIIPEREVSVSVLEKTITAALTPEKTLSAILQNDSILIGERYARDQELCLGDVVELMIPEPRTNNSIRFETHSARVGGIFKTGIDEFDAHIFFCSLDFLQKLFPESGVQAIGLHLREHTHEEKLIAQLKERFNLDAYSWKELYPALLSALTLEKYLMFFVLALITLVASMSMISLLFMLITQKRADIALLRSMGCSIRAIRVLFISIGLGIAASASICGIAAAVMLGYVLEHYRLISLPDVYYVAHLPAHITWSTCTVVFFVVIVLSFFASWFATRTVGTLNISHVLRCE